MGKKKQTTMFNIGDTVYYALEVDHLYIVTCGRIHKGIVIGNGRSHLYSDEKEPIAEFILVKDTEYPKGTRTIYIKNVPVLEKTLEDAVNTYKILLKKEEKCVIKKACKDIMKDFEVCYKTLDNLVEEENEKITNESSGSVTARKKGTDIDRAIDEYAAYVKRRESENGDNNND